MSETLDNAGSFRCNHGFVLYNATGTDANVSCVIYGDKGMTPMLPLENSANNFERGARDEFTVTSGDVGTLTQLQIGHDNK